MAKEKVLAKVATLLEKFSERLVRVARETRQNTDSIAALYDNVRLKTGKLEGAVEDLKLQSNDRDHQLRVKLNALGQEVNKITASAEDRETKQTARDQNNVQALVNLRDSTAKAFNQVRDDVAGLLKQIQRLNERVGQVESGVNQKLSGVSIIDQSIVNSKLSGVYSVTEDLEARIKELESEIELITAFRKAQAAFILGPVKEPKSTAASLPDADPRNQQSRG